MRRAVACVVIVAFLANCGVTIRKKEPREPIQEVQRYPLETSEYDEDVIVIDAEEREAMGLFQGIEGFKEARFIGTSSGGYEVEIVTDAKKLLSVNKDPNGMIVIREYVSRYEETKENPFAFESKWGILDYDTLGAPITRSEVELSTVGASATGCGCGFVAAAVAGLVVGAVALEEAQKTGESGADMGVGIGIMVGGLFLAGLAAVVAGVSTGCLTGRSAYERGKKNAVEVIKEQRMPKVVE